MVSPGSTRGHKGIEIEKFIARRSWRKYTAYAGGAHVEVKAGCWQRERQDVGHGLFLRSMGGVLRGFQLSQTGQFKPRGMGL